MNDTWTAEYMRRKAAAAQLRGVGQAALAATTTSRASAAQLTALAFFPVPKRSLVKLRVGSQ